MRYKVFVFGFFILIGCGSNETHLKQQSEEPTATMVSATETGENMSFAYNLKNPTHTWKLPEELVEVSGNTWVDENHLVLIEDQHAILYFVQIDGDNLTLEKTIPFNIEKNANPDIEDVTLVDDVIYALWSHGTLFKISNWRSTPSVEKIKTFLKKENNSEGLCYDPVTKKLLIACKDFSGLDDEKKSTRAVYSFDMQEEKLNGTPFLLIHKTDFEKVADEKLEFNPSAIAVHPVTKDIYMLSTKDNKCLAVYSRDGNLKAFRVIDKEMMPQPEGICFSPSGTLFISSEGKDGEPGDLFRFDPLDSK